MNARILIAALTAYEYRYLVHSLTEKDLSVELVIGVAKLFDVLRKESHDILVLDLDQIGSSTSITETIRAIRTMVPAETSVFGLSSHLSPEERTEAYDAGLDSCIDKPSHADELIARVERHLQRQTLTTKHASRTLVSGPLTIHLERCMVVLDGAQLILPRMEYALLLYLVEHPNIPLSTAKLLQGVWEDHGGNLDHNVVAVHMARLRKKFGKHGDLLGTVRGVGYAFRPYEE